MRKGINDSQTIGSEWCKNILLEQWNNIVYLSIQVEKVVLEYQRIQIWLNFNTLPRFSWNIHYVWPQMVLFDTVSNLYRTYHLNVSMHQNQHAELCYASLWRQDHSTHSYWFKSGPKTEPCLLNPNYWALYKWRKHHCGSIRQRKLAPATAAVFCYGPSEPLLYTAAGKCPIIMLDCC